MPAQHTVSSCIEVVDPVHRRSELFGFSLRPWHLCMLTLTARGQESPPSVLHLPGSVTCVVHPNHHTHAPSMLHLLSLPKTEACRCRYGAWFHPTRHCPSSATSSSGSASHSPGSTCWRRCGLSPSAPAAGDAYATVSRAAASGRHRPQNAARTRSAAQHSCSVRGIHAPMLADLHECLAPAWAHPWPPSP